MEKKRILAVCGPTAGGKSSLADDLADGLGEGWGADVPVVVVDSMQVYEGLAKITNQARRRPARLVGFVPVTERWTVARHRVCAEAEISTSERGVVLDSGTGMYLNAVLLDMPLAPEVPRDIRAEAERATAGAANPRRAAREIGLQMIGAETRRSIWDGEPKHETTMVYLRPGRDVLDAAIARRSVKIGKEGLDEAGRVKEMRDLGEPVNPSVLDSVGVRELLEYLDGGMTLEQAIESITVRTRRLARRQMRWFDKLARTLQTRDSARTIIVDEATDERILHTMHGTIRG